MKSNPEDYELLAIFVHFKLVFLNFDETAGYLGWQSGGGGRGSLSESKGFIKQESTGVGLPK